MGQVETQSQNLAEWLKERGVAERLVSCLSPQERAFLDIELGQRSLELYEDRLRKLGFVGRSKVLDLACGMGQWTVALGALNKEVVGVDKSIARMMIGVGLAMDKGASNVTFRWSRMEKLNFAEGEFDGVFCYGAFMFGRRDDTLAELRRVMRPGALLYLNANGLGWYLERLRRVIVGKLPLSELLGVGVMLAWTLLQRQRYRIYTLKGLKRAIQRAGFSVVACGAEGSIGGGMALYPGRLYGMDGVFELLCERR